MLTVFSDRFRQDIFLGKIFFFHEVNELHIGNFTFREGLVLLDAGNLQRADSLVRVFEVLAASIVARMLLLFLFLLLVLFLPPGCLTTEQTRLGRGWLLFTGLALFVGLLGPLVLIIALLWTLMVY